MAHFYDQRLILVGYPSDNYVTVILLHQVIQLLGGFQLADAPVLTC